MSVRIAEDVYSFIAEGDAMLQGWGANQGFIITDEGVVVVDTGFTRSRAEELRSEIRRRTDVPIVLVINTHDHSDHVFGNSVIADPETRILSHETCNRNISQYGLERMRQYKAEISSAFDGLDILPGSETYQSNFQFNLGGKQFELIHPEEGAHTHGDTMVFLPDDKVIFSGDVVWRNYHPNLEDADIDKWKIFLEKMSRLGFSRILPGHGPPTTKEGITEFRDYLIRFDKWLRYCFYENKSPAELIFHDSKSRHWKLEMIVKRNITILYDRFKF